MTTQTKPMKPQTITFSRGLPGFEYLRQFIVLPIEQTSHAYWLQSAQDPGIALLVTDPFPYFPDYSCTLSKADTADIKLENPSHAIILTVITVPKDSPELSTANLLAPIVINTKTNLGKQIILTGSPYTTKHLLFAAKQNKKPLQKNNAPPMTGKQQPCSIIDTATNSINATGEGK